jgi:hypothetical protein
MPSFNNTPPAPGAPNDMSTLDSFNRLEEFLKKNNNVGQFKVEDDNHGMGMLSTVSAPKQAVNVRLNQTAISNFMLNNGFNCNESICTRKE